MEGQRLQEALLGNQRSRNDIRRYRLDLERRVIGEKAIDCVLVLLRLYAARGVHEQTARLDQRRSSIEQLCLQTRQLRQLLRLPTPPAPVTTNISNSPQRAADDSLTRRQNTLKHKIT